MIVGRTTFLIIPFLLIYWLCMKTPYHFECPQIMLSFFFYFYRFLRWWALCTRNVKFSAAAVCRCESILGRKSTAFICSFHSLSCSFHFAFISLNVSFMLHSVPFISHSFPFVFLSFCIVLLDSYHFLCR